MRRLSAIILVTVGIAGTAFGLGGDHPPGPIAAASHPDWPAALAPLINSVDRVGGYWVNSNDFFYYRGDADKLKAFLAGYGKLTDTPLDVVIHSGTKPLTGPLGGERKTPYDWSVSIMRRGWGAPIDPRLPEKTPGYVVTVHVYVSSTLPLSALEIPRHISVRSGGEVEDFIRKHQETHR